MKLYAQYADALKKVESGRPFLPFVGGEAARIECCALAAKVCFGVPGNAAIDPWQVAAGVGIVVYGAEFFAGLPEEQRRQALEDGKAHWSAGTMIGDKGVLIVLNPTHSRTRQKATLGEELAHIVLGHPPSKLDPVTGLRTYNTDVESEAYAVGAAMILPYSQLFDLAKQGQSEQSLASRYEVSVPFVRARINRAGLRGMYRKRANA
ncbi:MAG: ImmA/IrrE family metallo-endopeptidase [Gaiellaceae bacterium]